MGLLPPSTNAEYRGAPIAAWFLGLLAVAGLAEACIHSFAPDGGAIAIAHLNLGDRPDLVIATFRWEGATQMALSLVMLLVAIRYRTLTALLLGSVIVERGLMALQGWVLAKPVTGHHPPEQYASLVEPLLALLFIVLALRRRPG